MSELMQKEAALRAAMSEYRRVVVGFSGGIDSTVVLDEAIRALGSENVLAVVADSVLFTEEECQKAVRLAGDLGVRVRIIQLDYLADGEVRQNTPESWYRMKRIFYRALGETATEFGADAMLDGMIMDDNADFRPGLRARDEAQAVSVLQVAGLFKTDVRALAHERGLQNWNKVASCSVSSRFPYYTELTEEAINRVKSAESFLRGLGFGTVRVRVHGDVARIEVPADRFSELLDRREQIDARLRELGYGFVALDLAGFESGRMNARLSADERRQVLLG